jgi:hypothetical protein
VTVLKNASRPDLVKKAGGVENPRMVFLKAEEEVERVVDSIVLQALEQFLVVLGVVLICSSRRLSWLIDSTPILTWNTPACAARSSGPHHGWN